MKKFEKNIYKCTGFWTWMQENGYAQNGHFLVENLSRRPDYYMVPTMHMLIGYLIDYMVNKQINIPNSNLQRGTKDLYDRLIGAMLEFEERNFNELLARAIVIDGYKICPQTSISKGDRVLVKTHEWYTSSCQRRGSHSDNFDCNGETFNKEMSRFCGEVLTICNASSDGQRFEVSDPDADRWSWNMGMMEGVIIE